MPKSSVNLDGDVREKFMFLPSILTQGQGGEGRVSKAENLRSPREIQSIFNLLGRTGKIIIFIIQVGI